MAKMFKDFSFNNQTLSGVFGDFAVVDFNGDSQLQLAMERDMDIGTTNTYRVEANYFGDTWNSTLPIEMHIIKNPCRKNQDDLIITKEEIRKITRWLTSPHYPLWIKFENMPDDDNDVVYYCGWFNNIETYCVGQNVYGLKLYFTCTTPFGYTDYLSTEASVSGYKNLILTNNSDELESYAYPQVKIKPNQNGSVFMCNLSDCTLLESGTLTLSEETYFDSLLTVVENYATKNFSFVRYTGTGTFNIVPICNDTAIQFYLVDKYNNETKCTAFYLEDTYTYWIVVGGFMYMNVSTDLEIYLDCQKLLITDSIGRMITYDELGISDVDYMYWLRYVNGYNTLLLYGNADFTFIHRESRKVGE